jgi:hypothetical protein
MDRKRGLRAVNVEDFKYLWEQPTRYVLVRLPDAEGPTDLLVYDTATRSAVLIDDEELDAAVVRRMIEEGVAIRDGLP